MKYFLSILILLFSLTFFHINFVNAGVFFHDQDIETDTEVRILVSFIDLRDRESFIQVTNLSSENNILHIQIFNVDQDCNENNFF